MIDTKSNDDDLKYRYRHPRPMVTVDAVILNISRSDIRALLIKRGKEPFKDRYALPGGFVDMDEDLADAAARELAEETGLTGVNLLQLGAFGKPGRDPRGRNIAVAYLGTVDGRAPEVVGADDAAQAGWFRVNDLPPLAFDHDQILATAVDAYHNRTGK